MTRLLLRAIDFGASAVSMALCARAFCVHFYKDMERGLQNAEKVSVTIADPSRTQPQLGSRQLYGSTTLHHPHLPLPY